MLRTTTAIVLTLSLTACAAGDFADSFSSGADAQNFGVATAVPTTSGSFAGIADTQTTVVQDGAGNGYAFAYADVNAADYGGGTGRGQYAVSGVLPGTSLGTMPTVGSARMAGTYNLVVVSGASATTTPDTWTVTRPTAGIVATIDFSTGRLTGASTDGALTLNSSGDAGFSNGFKGTASYLGTPGQFSGLLGPNDAVAGLTGQDDSRFYAGGFQIAR